MSTPDVSPCRGFSMRGSSAGPRRHPRRCPYRCQRSGEQERPPAVSSRKKERTQRQSTQPFSAIACPTNLPRLGGLQNLAPDHRVSLDLVFEILAAATEHARGGSQVRFVHHGSAFQVARVKQRQNRLLA